MKSHLHGPPVLNRGGETIPGNDSVFNRECWANLDSYVQKNQTGLLSYKYHTQQ